MFGLRPVGPLGFRVEDLWSSGFRVCRDQGFRFKRFQKGLALWFRAYGLPRGSGFQGFASIGFRVW